MYRRIFGLLGSSLGHSFSRNYFNDKFERENLECSYLNFDLPSIDNIREIINNIGLQGFNVTSPYKESIIHYMDYIDERAAEVKAVNVVKVVNSNKLYGYNTDIIGFEALLEEAISGRGIKNVLIFGSGGASKSVQYVLKQKNIPYYIVSRHLEKANLSYEEINKKGFGDYSLIINATPVGIFPNIKDHLSLPFDTFNENHIVIDLIYNPEETIFLQEAKRRHSSTYNGLKMLIKQADASWEIWNRQ